MVQPLQTAADAPWKLRFRAPKLLNAVVAFHRPERGLVHSNHEGVYQAYAWDVASGALRRLTNRAEGTLNAVLGPHGRFVYYLDDRRGNEVGHYVRFPYEHDDSAAESVTPDLADYSPGGFALSLAGNHLALLAGTADGLALQSTPLDEAGRPSRFRTYFQSPAFSLGVFLSADGAVVAANTTEPSGAIDFAVRAFDTRSGALLGELWEGKGVSNRALLFSPLAGDERLVVTTDRDDAERLMLWDPRSGTRHQFDWPDIPGALNALAWSREGRRLLFSALHQAVQRLYVYDFVENSVTRLDHPPGVYTNAFFRPDSEIMALVQDSTRPARLIALDASTGALQCEVLAAGDAPPGRRWRSVTFDSTDGQPIQAWLAVPDGSGPFPTILATHGGPTSVQAEVFSPRDQAWLDHGFAFFSVNYRGSTTFGRSFEQQIVGDLGNLEVEDMVAGRRWLVDQGIADPEDVFLTGWSYGGYLTLMAMSKYPALWAGGMAGIAIADWTTQYDDLAELLRTYQIAMLGGTPEERPELYAAASPLTYADRIAAPILIIQGRNDSRTPARPVELYEARLKALGKPVEVHWYDSGHMGAVANSEEALQHQERMMRFAYRVLNGEFERERESK